MVNVKVRLKADCYGPTVKGKAGDECYVRRRDLPGLSAIVEEVKAPRRKPRKAKKK